MHKKTPHRFEIALLAGLLGACSVLAHGGDALAPGDSAGAGRKLALVQTSAQAAAPQPKPAQHLSPTEWRARKGLALKRNWGVEIVGIKPVSSGYMLAFRYRIVDPDKAKLLNDRQSKAYVIDEATGIRLAVPALENVGELRTDATPKTDRTYFMIFGNPGKVVKSGSRVSVVVGNFKLDGLVVD